MGIVDNALIGASGQSGYNLTRSLRFRASASAWLTRTFSGTPQTYTLSVWLKRGSNTGSYQTIAGTRSTTPETGFLNFNANDTITFAANSTVVFTTTAVFRDYSAWYHIVLRVTQSGTAYLYVNNQQVGSGTVGASSFIFTNTMFWTNAIGRYGNDSSGYFDGYMAEFNFIDGQALTPSSFGSTNSTTGVWQPARYTGTYGTNGFYLPFTDNSALTTSSNVGLGKDFSGNGNYWTTNNISITAGTTYDSMTDVPTLTGVSAANFAVLSPLSTYNGGGTLSNGNLSVSLGTIANNKSTIGVSTGKFYSEITCVSNGGYSGTGLAVSSSGPAFGTEFMRCAYCNNGQTYNFNTSSYVSYGSSWTSGDVIGVAFDCDNKTVEFFKNGVSQGVLTTPSIGTSASWTEPVAFIPTAYNTGVTSSFNVNFGQRPFSYTPPTGFKALNTFNLPDSTIKQGNKVMDATLYTGNGSTQTITNAAGFKPDLVWIKSRSTAISHGLFDSVRGTNKTLYSNLSAAEDTYTDTLNSFNTNGFTLGSDATWGGVNVSGRTYVGWQWQAGQGTTSTNTSGTITSTVSVNASAGFSVVTWTNNNTANQSIGHGLGVTPSLIITKDRDNSTYNWATWFTGFTANEYLLLNTTGAKASYSTLWYQTPTSSVFYIGSTGTGLNAGTDRMVAYCFAPIAGYSAFGSYAGNGSADGPFVYLGFKPKLILRKGIVVSGVNWSIIDGSRNPYNLANANLFPNLSNAESVPSGEVDITSNGFKVRSTSFNSSGETYIYACFAESPFKNALAR